MSIFRRFKNAATSQSTQIGIEHGFTEAEVQTVVDRLEQQFTGGSLKFTTVFKDDRPVEAFGHYDGLRFHFVLNGVSAKLEMGPYDATIERLFHKRMIERYETRKVEMQQRVDSGNMSRSNMETMLMFETPTGIVEESNPRFTPTRLTRKASISVNSRDEVTANRLHRLFADLISKLVEVKTGDDIDTRTGMWLYGGWDMANNYDKAVAKSALNPEAFREGIVDFEKTSSGWCVREED